MGHKRFTLYFRILWATELSRQKANGGTGLSGGAGIGASASQVPDGRIALELLDALNFLGKASLAIPAKFGLLSCQPTQILNGAKTHGTTSLKQP